MPILLPFPLMATMNHLQFTASKAIEAMGCFSFISEVRVKISNEVLECHSNFYFNSSIVNVDM